MIIMRVKADNILCFNDFEINMSYPKKIVNSPVENEWLSERTNFRYKKVNILMGGNATAMRPSYAVVSTTPRRQLVGQTKIW